MPWVFLLGIHQALESEKPTTERQNDPRWPPPWPTAPPQLRVLDEVFESHWTGSLAVLLIVPAGTYCKQSMFPAEDTEWESYNTAWCQILGCLRMVLGKQKGKIKASWTDTRRHPGNCSSSGFLISWTLHYGCVMDCENGERLFIIIALMLCLDVAFTGENQAAEFVPWCLLTVAQGYAEIYIPFVLLQSKRRIYRGWQVHSE